MPKLKSLLPNIFGGNKEAHTTNMNSEGRLETDALPISDTDNNSGALSLPSNTPTASADLTESVLRELSDPNYNSMDVVQSAQIPGNALVNGNGSGSSSNNTMNTMNVHSAQQQVVMNFSNASNLHFGSVYNFNQNLSACSSRKGSTSTTEELASAMPPADSKRHVPRKTVSIVAMMQSQQEPDERLLDTVATHLGEGWKHVMRELGHSEGQIEQAIIDHQMHGNIKEVSQSIYIFHNCFAADKLRLTLLLAGHLPIAANVGARGG